MLASSLLSDRQVDQGASRHFFPSKVKMEAILMKKIFFVSLLIIFLLASLPATAKMKKLGQAGMTFLSIGGSARAAGMANVFTFAKNDLSSVFYNPAGLATVENRSFFFNYTSWIADMSVIPIDDDWPIFGY